MEGIEVGGGKVEDNPSTVSPQQSSKWKETPCNFCSELVFRVKRYDFDLDGGPKFIRQFFHGDCSNCSKDDPSHSLCAFCRHLRLDHIIKCVLLPPHDKLSEFGTDLYGVYLLTGWYRTKRSKSRCSLCGFFTDVVPKNARNKLSITIKTARDRDELFLGMNARSKPDAVIDIESEIDTTFRALIAVQLTEKRLFEPSSQLERKVDWNTVRSWDLLRSDEDQRLPRGFKVIDVVKECIVTPSLPCEYVSLSYLWGKPREGELQALRANIEELEKDGGLSNQELPATIRDAMTVCHQLGKRHLWVDRLCIVQDDSGTKHGQIRSMDRIYASSIATIAAASGAGARSGLAGISRRRVKRHKLLNWRGLELVQPFPRSLTDVVGESHWSQRGWTYQEAVCSKNILYFTNYGVFLDSPERLSECERLSYREDGTMSADYFDSVEQFTPRLLSYPTDILLAFAGILHWQENDWGKHHQFGIPLRIFDHAILWEPVSWDGPLRQCSASTTFPSWSWSSVLGGVLYDQLSITSSLVSWAFAIAPGTSHEGRLLAVPFTTFLKHWPPQVPLERLVDRGSRMKRDVDVMATAWEEGLFNKEFFTSRMEISQAPTDFTPSGESEDEIVQEVVMNFGTRHVEDPEVKFLEVFSSEDRKLASSKPGRILAFTQVARLNLEWISDLDDSRRVFLIRTGEGAWAGVIWLTAYAAESVSKTDDCSGNRQMEFLALSIPASFDMMHSAGKQLRLGLQMRCDGTWEPQQRPTPGRKAENIKEREAAWKSHEQEVTYVEINSPRMLGWDACTKPRINVMLISRHDGVARRLGIGQVYMKRWKQADPQFCTTVLE